MKSKAGFTRLDLLFCAAAAALLVFGALPAVGSGDTPGRKTLCLNNLRQLITAWQMYADDNDGRLVMNFHGGDAMGGAAIRLPRSAPWAMGWLDWGASTDNTNLNFLFDKKHARLVPYFADSAGQQNIYKCPEDNLLNAPQRAKGWKQRVRSVVMNGTVGTGNFEGNPGPFDSSMYVPARRMSELMIPGPAETFVFTEEHPDSINDPLLFVPAQRHWVDFPASFHQNSGNFVFADGHAETHIWQRSLRNRRVHFSNPLIPPTRPDDPDMHWVSYGSVRRTERSY